MIARIRNIDISRRVQAHTLGIAQRRERSRAAIAHGTTSRRRINSIRISRHADTGEKKNYIGLSHYFSFVG
jgi:hypothetical protein